MSKTKNNAFLVKGTIADQDYDRLLSEKCLDLLENPLKIGDKVAYGTVKRHADTVSIGEVVETWLEYGKNYQNYQNYYNSVPNINVINCYIKVKAIKSNYARGCTRYPSQVAKVV